MKQFIVPAFTLSLIFLAPFAAASGQEGYNSHRSDHGNKARAHQPRAHHSQVHRSEHVTHHKPRHKKWVDNRYTSHNVRHNHKRHHAKAGYLLGGLFLGAVINELASPKATVVKETVYVDREPNFRERDFVYLKDEYGDCYRVDNNRHGRVLTEVANAYCSAY